MSNTVTVRLFEQLEMADYHRQQRYDVETEWLQTAFEEWQRLEREHWVVWIGIH